MNRLCLHSFGRLHEKWTENNVMPFFSLFQITKNKYHTICIYCSSSSDALPILRMHIFTLLVYARFDNIFFPVFHIEKHRRTVKNKSHQIDDKDSSVLWFSISFAAFICRWYFSFFLIFSTHLTTIDELMSKFIHK